MVRGSWRPNRTAIYWSPLLWPSALCLSRSPGLLNRRPRGPALCRMMAFFAASYQQLLWNPTQSGAPRAPLVWCVFPYHLSSLTPTVTIWLLSWLSYIRVQRPLNLWNGMFDCHQVEITVMQFRGHLLAKSTYAISPHKCHRNVSLPSGASLWNGKFGRVEGQNTTDVSYLFE